MEKNNGKCCCGCNCSSAFSEFKPNIEKIKDNGGTLLMALQEAQMKYGYVDRDIIRMIAKTFDTTTTEVYSVASFYSQFKFEKQGKYRISLCLGTACYVRGAGKIQDKLESVLGVKMGQTTSDGKWTLGAARCVGCCGLAPVMLINEEVYGSLTPEKIPEIIAKYKE